jgi:lipopolysaccharide transport system ATP-binding protein
MDTVIKIENLSKLYKLGEVGTGTISHDLNRWWAKIRGKEDPYALVGQTNDRTKKSESDYVWSLKDINFEVKQGDVLGIIGKNGAGKSTLLKIISQITAPTTGSIKVKGRIAALLEVGTGMNPEMTARENIYLNGAILGMRKREIDSKFDEIVDFSGCAMYVETPIKRFSSGMRVRLGFAVAAFLEPEILIIDEVLAVGDAEFQKKAIGKMQDVSKSEGRTVIFVSHNLAAVKNLCKTGLVLKNGEIAFNGIVEDAINFYLDGQEDVETKKNIDHLKYIKDVSILNSKKILSNVLEMGEDFTIQIITTSLQDYKGLHIGFFIKNLEEERIASYSTAMKQVIYLENREIKSNLNQYNFNIKNVRLMEGKYKIDATVAYTTGGRIEFIENIYSFEIISSDVYNSGVLLTNYFGKIFLDVETTVRDI